MRRVFVWLTALSALASSAHGKPAQELSAKGDLCIKKGDSDACKDAGSVARGDVVSASTAGGVLVIGKVGTVTLDDGAQLRIEPSTMSLKLTPSDERRAEVVDLKTGKISIVVDEGKDRAMLVKGPGGLGTILRSGSFVVRVSGDAMTVATLKGASMLGAGSDWNDVTEGNLRTLHKGETKATGRKLPTKPGLAPRAAVAFAVPGRAATVTVVLKPVLFSERYLVTLMRDTGEVVESRPLAKSAEDREVTFAGLAPGAYSAHARSLDAEDFESPPSPPVPLTVIGVEVPKGAIVTPSGSIQLVERQRVKLSTRDGLEAALGGSVMFGPVPGELAMVGTMKQVLRVRRKGDTGEGQLVLEPFSLRADVVLGPKTAMWPRDAIDVTVRLRTNDGTPLPATTALRATALLGLDPIDVSLVRDGDVFRAKVAPRAIEKPTALRIEVFDELDHALGRGFVEITREGAP